MEEQLCLDLFFPLWIYFSAAACQLKQIQTSLELWFLRDIGKIPSKDIMEPEMLNAANDPGLGRDIRAQDTILCPSPSLGSKLLIALFMCASEAPFLSPPSLLFLPLLQISVPFRFLFFFFFFSFFFQMV